MTNCNTTATPTDPKNTPYPYLVANTDMHRIAEDADEYTPQPFNPGPLPWEMKRLELRALQMAGFGQIGRLYKLAKLLLGSEPGSWTAEQLQAYALEIRKTANRLEDLLMEIIGPIVNDPEQEHDEPDCD